MGLMLTRRALHLLYNLAFAYGKDPSEMLAWLIERAADDWEREREAGQQGASGSGGDIRQERPYSDGTRLTNASREE